MQPGASSGGFKPLSEIQANETVSVYGRVLTCKPPRQTRGTDYSMTLFISDGSISGDIAVNIFRPHLTDFPPLTPTNESVYGVEVVQLRRFKAQSFGGALQLLSAQWSGWTVFFKDDLGKWKIRGPAGNFQPSDKEALILDHLITATDKRKRESEMGPTAAPASTRPLLTVRDLAPNIYCDLTCQVLKVLKSANEDVLFTALVTDYTENDKVHFESNEFEEIPSYMRNAILHVSIWDNFVPVAKEVMQEGVIVTLRNLHARNNNIDGSLAAVLHGDTRCSRPQHYIFTATGFEDTLHRRKEELEKLEELTASHIPQMSLTKLIKEPKKLAWSRLHDIIHSPLTTGVFKTRAIVKKYSKSAKVLRMTLQDNTGELEVAVVGERLQEFLNGGEFERLARSLLPSEFCIFSYLNHRVIRKFQIFNTRILC